MDIPLVMLAKVAIIVNIAHQVACVGYVPQRNPNNQ